MIKEKMKIEKIFRNGKIRKFFIIFTFIDHEEYSELVLQTMSVKSMQITIENIRDEFYFFQIKKWCHNPAKGVEITKRFSKSC